MTAQMSKQKCENLALNLNQRFDTNDTNRAFLKITSLPLQALTSFLILMPQKILEYANTPYNIKFHAHCTSHVQKRKFKECYGI